MRVPRARFFGEVRSSHEVQGILSRNGGMKQCVLANRGCERPGVRRGREWDRGVNKLSNWERQSKCGMEKRRLVGQKGYPDGQLACQEHSVKHIKGKNIKETTVSIAERSS